jgi:hypothetical protein
MLAQMSSEMKHFGRYLSRGKTKPGEEAGSVSEESQRGSLAVCAARCPQLSGHEVIWGPRATNQDFAIF